MGTKNLLINFVSVLQKKYPNVIFRFEFDEEEKMYRIWHTYNDVYTDDSFCEFLGQMISEMFVPANFYDYYIELNTQYLQAMNTTLIWQIPKLNSFTINSIPLLSWESKLDTILVRNFSECPSNQGEWKPQEQTEEKDKPEQEKILLAA